MSLVPILLREFWDNDLLESELCPRSRCLDKHSGSLLSPRDFLWAITDNVPDRRQQRVPAVRKRQQQWMSALRDQDEGGICKRTKDGFEVDVDCKQYKPEEISVKATNKYISVEGKHEQKEDENNYVLRHFVRRYQLPEGVDSNRIASSLSADGVLTVKAPNLALPESEGERTIPVIRSAEKAPAILQAGDDKELVKEKAVNVD
uniref:Putative alpha crystallins protein n=1 Tax=Psorophora albipes TaxID=869069 RepID=T1DF40_9DIPT